MASSKNPRVHLPPFEVKHVVKALSQSTGWQISKLKVDELWKKTRGRGVKVAIVDTGIDAAHPDLEANVRGGVDLVNKHVLAPIDANGHGTHCAGIVAASDNSTGMVGVAPEAELYSVRVLDENGSGDVSTIVAGLEWCLKHKMDVVSMSLGMYRGSRKLHDVCKKLNSAGITLVAAAGNDGTSMAEVDFPGRYPETLCVGSIRRDFKRSDFSSVGPNLDILAPGDEIYSTFPRSMGMYAILSGTSMATPFVAGLVALMKSAGTKRGSVQDIREGLQRQAMNRGKTRDRLIGYGVVCPKLMFESESGGVLHASRKK